MTAAFDEAAARAQQNHSKGDWWLLSPAERSRLIYTELKKVDLEEIQEKAREKQKVRVKVKLDLRPTRALQVAESARFSRGSHPSHRNDGVSP
jgi:hypothetical protein